MPNQLLESCIGKGLNMQMLPKGELSFSVKFIQRFFRAPVNRQPVRIASGMSNLTLRQNPRHYPPKLLPNWLNINANRS